jgi:transcriptional repressor NrdR
MPMVVKTDGRRETFSIEKIKLGIQKSCQKRPVSTVQIDHIVEQIEKTIHELGDKEISTAMIGRLVMDHLQLLDPVAYVRFASVYRNFQDVEEFVQNLRLENKNSTTVPKAEH